MVDSLLAVDAGNPIKAYRKILFWLKKMSHSKKNPQKSIFLSSLVAR
jgi:hypothetical protein